MAHSLQQLFSFLIHLQDDLLAAVKEPWLQGAFSTQIQFFTSVLCFLRSFPSVLCIPMSLLLAYTGAALLAVGVVTVIRMT